MSPSGHRARTRPMLPRAGDQPPAIGDPAEEVGTPSARRGSAGLTEPSEHDPCPGVPDLYSDRARARDHFHRDDAVSAHDGRALFAIKESGDNLHRPVSKRRGIAREDPVEGLLRFPLRSGASREGEFAGSGISHPSSPIARGHTSSSGRRGDDLKTDHAFDATDERAERMSSGRCPLPLRRGRTGWLALLPGSPS
jgi:hypothetical protein